MTATGPQLADLVRDRSVILFDFDGPICSVFAGYPAATVASELRRILGTHGAQFDDEEDPLQLLLRASRVAPKELVRAAADALRDKETEAVDTAKPTPGGDNLIRAAHASGRIVAIVSNNSEGAVNAYLRRHELAEFVNYVSARYDGMNPALLKPNPHLLQRALNTLDTTSKQTIFIGDSRTDVAAGLRCHVPTIGYANRPPKLDTLTAAGAAAIIDDLSELRSALIATGRHSGPPA